MLLEDINKPDITVLDIYNPNRKYIPWGIQDEWGGFDFVARQKVFSTRIAKAIADILMTPTCKIKQLIMSNSYITCEGAGQIAKALEINKSLEILDISNNDLNNRNTSNIPSIFEYNNNNKIPWKFDILPWEKTLKKSLETNNTLKTLKISITNSDLELLLKNPTMPNIKELDISENRFDSFDLEQFLEHNKSLTSLTMKNMKNFKNNEDNVLKALRNGLRKNTTLTKLNISNNFKNHVRNLISNNNIRNESILLDIFTDKDIYGYGNIPNTTLVEFNIYGNNFSDDVINKIIDALENNKELVLAKESIKPVKGPSFLQRLFRRK